ncbi:hypothetical protein ACH46F_02920 [Streptomyces virginiae]|uniref:hypothetical protein n=1 Tax=Streptomyces virginiae TaxID=1961 RepID=UPI0037A6885D
MAPVLPNGAIISDAADAAINAAQNRSEYEEALRQAPACSYPDPFGVGVTFYAKTADGHLFLNNTPLAPDGARCEGGRLWFDMARQEALLPDETERIGNGSDPDPKTGQVY